jgi:plastocyanin
MRRRPLLRTAGALAVPGVATLAGCTGGGDGDQGTRPANTVDMVTKGTTYYFDPIGLHVDAGETVTFRVDNGNHSAVAYTESHLRSDERRIPDDAEGWKTDTIRRGSVSHTFETEGTHDYYCGPHKNLAMVGRIIVGTTGGPAEESPIPDGEVPESNRIVEEGSVSWAAFSG